MYYPGKDKFVGEPVFVPRANAQVCSEGRAASRHASLVEARILPLLRLLANAASAAAADSPAADSDAAGAGAASAASQSEDDGYVLTLLYDSSSRCSRLDILDARSMQRVCAIALPHHVPMGLHGFWSSAYLGSDPAASSQPTEYDIRNGAARYE